MKTVVRKRLVGGFGTVIATVMISGSAMAQQAAQTPDAGEAEALEEIVVTAERRETNMQKTGLSISVRQGEDLASQGRVSLPQILEDVPGLGTFPAATPSTRAGSDMAGGLVTIRGVAASPGTAGSLLMGAPAAAVYTDGVYEGIGGSYDLASVEVLRGPQGTLYGRSATSGVVRVSTRDPLLEEFGADLSVEVGNYHLQNYTAAVNMPVGETLAVRVAGNIYKRDGYYPSEGRLLTYNGRIKLLWKPGEDVSLLLGAVLQDNHTQAIGISPNQGGPSRPDPNTVTFDPIRSSTGVILADGNSRLDGINKHREYWAEANWDLGPATLTYVPTYRTWYLKATVYASGALSNFLVQPLSVPNDTFMTHELRLASRPGSNLSWQVGGFFYRNDVTSIKQAYYIESGTLNFDINARRRTKDIGLFGEATLRLSDALRLTAGGRYDWTTVRTDETYRANAQGVASATAPYNPNPTITSASTDGSNNTSRFNDFTYKARVEYDLSPRNLVYGMISTAFVPGDVQITTQRINNVTTPVVALYNEERLTSYELGSKNRFLNGALQVNGALFYYNFSGFQASLVVDPANPASQRLVNVPVRMVGGELEIEWRLTSADRISLNGGLTNAKITDGSGLGAAVYPGQTRLWNVVPWSVNGAYSHRFQLADGSSLVARAAARWVGAYDLVNVSTTTYAGGGYPFQRRNESFIGDLDLNWSSASGRYSVTAYLRNVGDVRYKASVGLTSADGGGFAFLSDPRTVGAAFTAHF